MANHAFATLVTRASYVAGAVILAHTLKSQYPLVIVYTATLPEECVQALEKLHVVMKKVEPLLPSVQVKLIAERFADTWTKLRVFELEYDMVCFLDADMMVMGNADEIFDTQLPEDWLASTPICCCNLDKDPWAPADWVRENCAFTVDRSLSPKHPRKITTNDVPTHQLINGGMFLFRPTAAKWKAMLDVFDTSDRLQSYKFPDQDFLSDYYKGRLLNVGWRFNALKTMKYWHGDIWRDEEVVFLHYIVDKPWARRVEDGVAGYLGRDGETHQWWWNAYDEWEASADSEVVSVVRKYVAHDGENAALGAIGSRVQAFANN